MVTEECVLSVGNPKKLVIIVEKAHQTDERIKSIVFALFGENNSAVQSTQKWFFPYLSTDNNHVER